MMSESRNKLGPEDDAPTPTENERQRGAYYDDDATGYEVYDPNQEVEDNSEVDDSKNQESDSP